MRGKKSQILFFVQKYQELSYFQFFPPLKERSKVSQLKFCDYPLHQPGLRNYWLKNAKNNKNATQDTRI